MVRNTNNHRVRNGMELIEKRTNPRRYLQMINYVRVQKRDLCIRRKQVINNNGVQRMKTSGVSELSTRSRNIESFLFDI